MATVALPSSPPLASPPLASPSIVLEGVPWDDYEAMLRIVGERHIRINDDDGRMELVSPLLRHGDDSLLLVMMAITASRSPTSSSPTRRGSWSRPRSRTI